MVISLIFVSSFLITALLNIVFSYYYSLPTRLVALLREIFSMSSIFNLAQGIRSMIVSLLILLAFINFVGNIPGLAIPSLYYYFTCSVSLIIWLSLMVVIFITQAREFIAHILPYGSPAALMIFLPLVEIFSQIIRPFTLMVRLSTNLSSGHIILYMFSFFSISSFSLTFILFFALIALLLLELFISILQAYIFTSLIYLYVSEGLGDS